MEAMINRMVSIEEILLIFTDCETLVGKLKVVLVHGGTAESVGRDSVLLGGLGLLSLH